MYPEDERDRRLRYEQQPSVGDFAYYYIPSLDQKADLIDATVVQPALNEVVDRYSIQVKILHWGDVPEFEGRVPYFLVGPIDPLTFFDDDGQQVEHPDYDYLARLSALAAEHGARINFITAFDYSPLGDSEKYRQLASKVIPTLDQQLGINTIYADSVDGLYTGTRTVTARDIADNIVCETIRLKYQAIEETNQETLSALEFGQKKYTSTIEELRKIFSEYGLYHRAPTDGAVVIKLKDGWLVSQTKTDKTTMTAENFSFVPEYNAEAETAKYTGSKLPSSDAPEFLKVMDMGKLDEGSIIVHFHHNPTTRGGKFPEHTTQNLIEYGRFESTDEVLEEFQRIGDDWVLLKEHGIMWVGYSDEPFEKFVSETLGIEKNRF